MSESDDTDILLLIPPDFFNIKNHNTSPDSVTPQRSVSTPEYNFQMDCVTNDYIYRDDYNSPRKLQYFNTTSTPRKIEQNKYAKSAKSSSVSSSSAATTVVPPSAPERRNSNNILSEIDNFLHTDNIINQPQYSSRNCRINLEDSLIDCKNMSLKEFQSIDINDINALDNNNKRLFLSPRKAESHSGIPRKNNYNSEVYNKDHQLISLGEIWGCNTLNSISGASNNNSTLQEEKVRRQHLEKSIHSLQMQLLEYQQKIAVAVNVDQDKNEIISTLEETRCKLDKTILELERKNLQIQEQMYEETRDTRMKNQLLEQEMADAIELVKKFQNKNEILELKVENLSSASNEISSIHKAQLKDCEIRLSNSLANEKLLKEENANLKKEASRLKGDIENVKNVRKENDELKEQIITLKQQKENFCSSLNQERHNKENIEKRNKSLLGKIEELTNKEKNLAKELDIQRISLKKYYQTQLEEVVGEKLKEFQNQLNHVEESLKEEGKQRERLLAERAIKQIELILQKNDQEVSLLTEKYNEEISLYRIQLSNASTTIQDLERKLSTYRDKRADIAERLHNIMEMQWQKALDVLTNPSTSNDSTNTNGKFRKINAANLDKDKADDVQRLLSQSNSYSQHDHENDIYETPLSSRNNNERNRNQNHINESSKDLLQNYIEMLLKKSPKDLEQLELLMSARKPSSTDGNQQCFSKHSSTKRPWK